MEEKKLRIAILPKDDAELVTTIKSLSGIELSEICSPILYGNASAIENIHENHIKKNAIPDEEDLLGRVMEDVMNKKIDGVVTTKQVPFQTIGCEQPPLSIFMGRDMCISFVAVDGLSKDELLSAMREKIQMMCQSLRRDLRRYNPRIAVLASQSKANDTSESAEDSMLPSIREQIESLFGQGETLVFGPYDTETFFKEEWEENFDGIIVIGQQDELNVERTGMTLPYIEIRANAPVVCISPVYQETALEAVNSDNQQRKAYLQAIYAVIDVVRNRYGYDAPLVNPLPKLYYERRDDSDKARFTIRKNGEDTAADKEITD